MTDFLKELDDRKMIHQFTPGLPDLISKHKIAGYVGFDPTADSLHVGNLAAIMLLKHLQLAGHTPIILVGGATGMIGDPSGKKSERQFLTLDALGRNVTAIEKQLKKFLNFNGPNPALVVNNHDWISRLSLLDFLRVVGKNASVNVMMNRDSVKNRIEDEDKSISFTEFTYQLIQAYDFAKLYETEGCFLQMGGSDQWGNMTAGIDLIHRLHGGNAQALTCPLITKADGQKFGKSEQGNVWLDSETTTPFQFFQFWYQLSDVDADKFLPIFTLLSMDEIGKVREVHAENPSKRLLQLRLASEVTKFVHGDSALNEALLATEILYNDADIDEILTMSSDSFKRIFANVPQSKVKRQDFESGDLFDALANSKGEEKVIFSSKGDVRRTLQGGGLYINKKKVEQANAMKDQYKLIHDKYWIVQNGKKKFYLLELVD
jgi:tyrosyl-tRNA synthetase